MFVPLTVYCTTFIRTSSSFEVEGVIEKKRWKLPPFWDLTHSYVYYFGPVCSYLSLWKTVVRSFPMKCLGKCFWNLVYLWPLELGLTHFSLYIMGQFLSFFFFVFFLAKSIVNAAKTRTAHFFNFFAKSIIKGSFFVNPDEQALIHFLMLFAFWRWAGP